MRHPRRIGLLLWLLVLLAAQVYFFSFSRGRETVTEIPYSTFLDRAARGQITAVQVGEEQVSGTLKDGSKFRAYVPAGDLSYLQLLQAKGAIITVQPAGRRSVAWRLIASLLPFLLLLGLWIFMSRRAQGNMNQVFSFNRSPARNQTESRPKVTFADVAGVDEAKEELVEIIEFLKSPARFQSLGARIPRGVLLVGPPGSGKTLLAKAVAGEAQVPFFSIAASQFVEMFVGVGASRVRATFEQAKKSAPCLVFIDELDAVGRQRGAGLGGGHDEREQTLNQLLVEMDGFDPNTGIMIIAATNRPDILDPALLRPGRFDRRVVVDNPDGRGRRAILDVHARGKPLAEDVDLEALARSTPGFSGADLANLVNEAALLAVRADKRAITMAELDEAVERVIAGPQRRSRVLSRREREVAAYHEGGHALLGRLLPHADPPRKVTILPRGMALGYVISAPAEDRYTYTRTELLDRITAALGGRVAEEHVFGEVTTGAQNDFEQSTDLARRMVTEFGMSEKLGPLSLGKRHGPVFLGRDLMETRNYSDEIAYEIDKEVRRIIDDCYGRARAIITERRDTLERVARALLEKEALDAVELDRAIRGAPALAIPGAPEASTSPAKPARYGEPVRPASGRGQWRPRPQAAS